MLEMHKSFEGRLVELGELEADTWINLHDPTDGELRDVAQRVGVPIDFLTDPLDADERARIEVEDGAVLIIVRAPILHNESVPYVTLPIGIVLTPGHIVTVCRSCTKILDFFAGRRVKSVDTSNKTRFAIMILQRVAVMYLTYLQEINRRTELAERELHKSMRNKELIDIMNIEKSLVFFMTSLKSNDIMMERLLRGRVLMLTEDDNDLLDDALTENRQAISVTKIYSDILSGMSDALASIISNNMNMVMKLLTGVTIIMMIPNIITGIYGMNIDVPLRDSPYAFSLVTLGTLILSALGVMVFIKKRWF